jgi:hypothetical protein
MAPAATRSAAISASTHRSSVDCMTGHISCSPHPEVAA